MKYRLLNKNKESNKILYLLENEDIELTFDNVVLITVDNWNDELSPYAAKVTKMSFAGKASETLASIIEIVDEVEKGLTIEERYIGGYSLAGLFAFYGYCNSNLFTGIMSASSSLWFPDYAEKIIKANITGAKIYLSLGEREEKTRNQIMATVGEKTRKIYQHLKENNEVIYQVNEGGHFDDVQERIEKGISWLYGNK